MRYRATRRRNRKQRRSNIGESNGVKNNGAAATYIKASESGINSNARLYGGNHGGIKKSGIINIGGEEWQRKSTNQHGSG